ncbi:MAG: hypothetical protein LBT51_08760 [Fusobacteriaceae bacterium]|nr:hypothetical protein [Fusobacteriaceae bacterium]
MQAQYETIQQELLDKIAAQKIEIEQMLEENENRLRELKISQIDMLKQGDYFSKPWAPSFFYSVIGSYEISGNLKNNWTGSVRRDTPMDKNRELFGDVTYGNGEKTDLQNAIDYTMDRAASGNGNLSTGWLNGSEAYNTNTNVYDYEDKLMILPIVRPPEVEEPVAPMVAFTTPNPPVDVNVVPPDIIEIDVEPVDVNFSLITPPGGVDVPSVVAPTVGDINADVPNVNIGSIVVNQPSEPSSPTIPINPPPVSVNVTNPRTIEPPNPNPPAKDIVIPTPSASPFTGFTFDGGNSAISVVDNGITLYSGIDPTTIGNASPTPMLRVGGVGVVSTNTRPTNILYRSSPNLYNIKVYVMGYSGGYIDAGSGTTNGAEGTIAFHTLLNGNLTNIDGYLYGKAGLMTSETWRHGQVTMTNVNVEVRGSDNSVYYVMPAAFATINGGLTSTYHIGGLLGTTNIKMYGTNNTVYLSAGISGARRIENNGKVELEGASNIVYSGMSYVPDWQKAKGGYLNKMTSTIKISEFIDTSDPPDLSRATELYGDENIVLFFGSKIQSSTLPRPWTLDQTATQDAVVERRASYIGIYQGEIDVTANIGTKLNISGTGSQTTQGILSKDDKGYTSITVDGAVGIFSKSGQRAGIVPTTHLGVPTATTTGNFSYLDNDTIHSLEVAKLNIRFGKYAKNGFMIVSQLGTVIDIGKNSTGAYIIGVSSSFSDGIKGISTDEGDASTGTIIAYANGIWDQLEHKLGSALGGPMLSTDLTLINLQGKPSQVNIHIPLNMISKEGIAYFGDNSGIVNVVAAATTTAYGYQSIIGYARDKGAVNISSNIIAQDAGVTTSAAKKYQNIGAYAGVGALGFAGTVKVTGNATINGIGAFANGTGTKVYLKADDNEIFTGINGGLVALDGGYVEFGGGDINHEEISSESHDRKVPFYADSTSQIDFTGTTALNISNGVVFYGSFSDYFKSASVTGRYTGMENVTVNLIKDGVTLGVFDGETLSWTDESDYIDGIKAEVFANINIYNTTLMRNVKYNSYLINGDFSIGADASVSLDSGGFENIVFQREKITIAATANVFSTLGNGLILGSNIKANLSGENLSSGYTNNGTINITDTTASKDLIGIYTSYGHVNNTGTITVGTFDTKDIGVVGVNGSKIINKKVGNSAATITVNALTNGIGIAGFARRTRIDATDPLHPELVVDTAEGYGTDSGGTTNLIDIDNQGTITVHGDNAIAIYADNNINGDRSKVIVKNSKALTLGDGGVGLMVKGSTEGGTITLTDDTAGTDITVGKDGIGLYAENSDITITGSPYEIEVKDRGIGILTTGDSLLNSGTLKLKYTGNEDESATALVYVGTTGETMINNIEIVVDTSGVLDTFGVPGTMAGKVTGIYATDGGTLINKGNITATTGKAYGITSKSVDIKNEGKITTGTTSGGVAIFATDAAVTTDGDMIEIKGTGAIGVYATDTTSFADFKTILVEQGTDNLKVEGINAVGIFIKDATTDGNKLILNNSSKIDITPSDEVHRRIGIYLEGATSANNENSAEINVVGQYIPSPEEKTGYNIGIYSKDSYLNQTGTINVTGIKNIGIFAESTGTNANILDLSGGIIDVKTATMADTDISIGIYGKGKNIRIYSSTSNTIIVAPNAVGIYLDGDDTSKITGTYAINLSSNGSGKVGIGAYYKGGAHADGTVNLTATTALVSGDPIRPIGLFYGEDSEENNAGINILLSSDELIGIYGKSLVLFENAGDITINAKSIGAYFEDSNVTNDANVTISATATGGYGLYFKGGTSSLSSPKTLSANADDSIGAIIVGNATGLFTNNGTITASGIGSIGVYTESSGEFINNGILNASLAYDDKNTITDADDEAGSIGAFAKNAKIENKDTINTKYVGLYGGDGGEITQTSGTISITADKAIGILVKKDTAAGIAPELALDGGTISSTYLSAVGVVGANDGEITLNGTNISLTGDKSVGIYLNKSTYTDTTTGNGGVLNLTSGNITVGVEGTAIYGKDSTINLANYGGTLTLGNKGIGIYSEDNTITIGSSPDLTIEYTNNDKGVGVYYKGTTTAVTNEITIDHQLGGKNLVHIYADGVNVTNTANQEIKTGGIGLLVDHGSESSNTATLTLSEDNTVGIYVGNTGTPIGTSELSDIGTISGTDLTAVPSNWKIGVYVANGDIVGASTYNFSVNGGIAMYLENDVISYTGTINLSANSITSILGNRAIGVYVSETIITGTLNNNINVTGADAVGIYLATDAGIGAKIIYNGELKISSTGSTPANRGIGVILEDNAEFTLGTLGKVEISNANNIGFYVKPSAILSVSGGQVRNEKDGIFAYIEDGTINFTSGSTIDIDFINIIVSGTSGTIENYTTIKTGTVGLQASLGAQINNYAAGIINATVDNGKALVGSGTGTQITNAGEINLVGEGSVGIYTDNDAAATSTGYVNVGDKSVAYYAGRDQYNISGTIDIINGTTTIGKDSTMMYANGGNINYTGSDISLGGERTVLVLSNVNSKVDFGNIKITAGEKGVGIFVRDTGEFNLTNIQNLSKILVEQQGTGIFIDNTATFNHDVSIDITGNEGIGIFTTNSADIDYSGILTSSVERAKGILSTGTGNLTNNVTIKLLGNSSIGIYSKFATFITNALGATIEISNGSLLSGVMNSAVGIYAKGGGTVDNDGTIKMKTNAVGIYSEGATVANDGTIEDISGSKNTAIYAIGGSITNTGTIKLGDTSNGIFVKNGTSIINTGDITTGDNKSSGIYGAGTTVVDHQAGTIKVGKNSVGAATEQGNVHVFAGANIIAGEDSTYVYTESGTGTLDASIALSDYSMGMYTKTGNLINNGIITVGKSFIASVNQKISVGMATGTNQIVGGVVVHTGGGAITNDGTINIPYDNGVGMIANNPTATGINNGDIYVSGKEAYGMEASEKATIINTKNIYVTGTNARGMAATTEAIVINDTTGNIYVTGEKAEGIYVGLGAEARNYGTITVDGIGRTGIFIGQGGVLINKGNIIITNGADATIDDSMTTSTIGTITIESAGPTITVGDVIYDAPTLINGGYIELQDTVLDFGTIKIGSTEGNIGTISAKAFNDGEFIVLPTATQGDNKPIKVIQYLKGVMNVPNNGSLKAISHSVTWLADIQADPYNANIYRIVMVKIPYAELTANTKAFEFGLGLDEIYVPAVGTELKMFDAIDLISDKDELGATFDMELRGNIYANIQERMYNIKGAFGTAYENLKHERLYSRESVKIGTILAGGEIKDNNPGIENYEYRTIGLMLLKEYDKKRYGRKLDWNLGFTQTKFDFDFGSNETVYSLDLGLGYEDYIGASKNLKWITRGEIVINKHDLDRKIKLSNGVYTNNAKYWSGIAEWKNTIRYDIPIDSARVKVGIFGTFNLGYGKFENIKETGDGIYLDIKSKDMFIMRPGIGADVTYTKYLNRSKISLTGTITAEYELGKFYDGVNQAKIKGTKAGYYDLEEPKEMKELINVGVQLRYETKAGHSIVVDIAKQKGNVDSIKYGLNFIYRYDH